MIIKKFDVETGKKYYCIRYFEMRKITGSGKHFQRTGRYSDKVFKVPYVCAIATKQNKSRAGIKYQVSKPITWPQYKQR